MDQVSSIAEQPGTDSEKTTRFTYTRGGQVETICKPDGVVLTHTYDGLNRLIDLSSSDGTIHYRYTYDLHNNPISVSDDCLNVTLQKGFDQFDHVLSEQFWAGIGVSYAYDLLGRCTNYGVNGAPSVEYGYSHGHLTDVIRTDAAGAELYRHQYTGIDLEEKVLEGIQIQNLGTVTQTFDPMSRLTSITTPYWREVIPQGGYDSVGNLLQATVHDNFGDTSYQYSYDNLYQLIQEGGVFSDVYACDSLNNRLEKNSVSYQINPLNQLLSESSSTYNYDKNGNLIEILNGEDSLTFQYDALDRLVGVEKTNSFRIEMLYDSTHRRLLKRTFSWIDGAWQLQAESRFLYLGNREVGSFDAQNNPQEFRILGRGKGAEIGATVGIEMDGSTFCPVHDHRGNIVTLVDVSSKSCYETYRFSAFGEESLFNSEGPSSAARNPWRFAGKRTDPETGFVFFGQRYYSPCVGRFVTPDPVGFSDGPNLYAYVHNSPLVLVDPYGLTALDDAEEIGQDTVMGALQGFVHPLDTAWNDAGYASDFVREAYHGDFSRVTNASGVDVARFVGARAGEAVGATVSVGLSLGVVNAAYKIGCAGFSYAKGTFGSLAKSFVRKESAAFGAESAALAAGERKAGQFLTGNVARADCAADVTARGISTEAGRTGRNFKPLTKGNCRENLKELTGISPPGNVHAHHVFPQRLEERFLARGVNIHDPQHLTWWEASGHLPNARGYGAEWRGFMGAYPDATKAQILEQGKQMMKEHKIGVNY